MVGSLSDESQHDGIGGIFDDDEGTVQSPQQIHTDDEPDVQKQPLDVKKDIFEFLDNHNQVTETRLLNPVTDVPTVSAVPSLDRTEETMSSSTRSIHGAVEAISSSEAETTGQTHNVLEIAHHFHRGTFNAVPYSSSDISGGSSSASPHSCLSPSNTAITSPSMHENDRDGYDSLTDDYLEDAYQYSTSQYALVASPRLYDDDQQTDYTDQDSPPYDGGDDNDENFQRHTAREEDQRTSTIGTDHGSVEGTGVLQQKDQPTKRAAEDDGNDHRSPVKSKRLKKHEESHLRLACPFYKYDPVRYRQCHAKVLKRNSYVKQHLFRSHMQPIYCDRCLSTWPSDEKLREHLRTPHRCEVREYIAPEGITPDQKQRLQSRLGGSNKSESDQWFELYAILFPGEQKPKSAYLDGELSEDLESLREFIERRGTDIMMGQLIGSSVLQQDGVGSHELHLQVQNALTNIFDGWHNQRKEMGSDSSDGRSKRVKLTPAEFPVIIGQGPARTDTASTSTTMTIGLDEHVGNAESSPANSAT